MMDVIRSFYFCNGCRSINRFGEEEPETLEVHVISKEGEERLIPYRICPNCQKKIEKGQAVFPYD